MGISCNHDQIMTPDSDQAGSSVYMTRDLSLRVGSRPLIAGSHSDGSGKQTSRFHINTARKILYTNIHKGEFVYCPILANVPSRLLYKQGVLFAITRFSTKWRTINNFRAFLFLSSQRNNHKPCSNPYFFCTRPKHYNIFFVALARQLKPIETFQVSTRHC